MKIQIIHERDPDSSCYHRVFIDGIEMKDIEVVDIDPGRGYDREDWDENVEYWQERPQTPFAQAVIQAYLDASDSEYIT